MTAEMVVLLVLFWLEYHISAALVVRETKNSSPPTIRSSYGNQSTGYH